MSEFRTQAPSTEAAWQSFFFSQFLFALFLMAGALLMFFPLVLRYTG
jgi:hypothetical protein